MEHSKPKVTIDLDEYNELLKIKMDSEQSEDSRNLTDEELSETIHHIIGLANGSIGEKTDKIFQFTRKISITHAYNPEDIKPLIKIRKVK